MDYISRPSVSSTITSTHMFSPWFVRACMWLTKQFSKLFSCGTLQMVNFIQPLIISIYVYTHGTHFRSSHNYCPCSCSRDSSTQYIQLATMYLATGTIQLYGCFKCFWSIRRWWNMYSYIANSHVASYKFQDHTNTCISINT